jgi:leucyl/phenylalanyl-tRNA---protein transferase
MNSMANKLHWIDPTDAADASPSVDTAMIDPPGLLAAGGDLSPERLLAGYRRGIFPWYSTGQPVLWWSPDPRCVLWPAAFKCSKSLAKAARNRGFELRIDTCFAQTVASCGDRSLRSEGTWITRDMKQAYQRLHQQGYAHSVETWLDGQLVGGLYGVQLGRVFYGESMFSRTRDASKFALRQLCGGALPHLVELIDCQMTTPHLESLGATTLPRSEFVAHLALLTGAEESR